MIARALCAAAVAAVLAGCVTERSKAVPSIPGPLLGRSGGGAGADGADPGLAAREPAARRAPRERGTRAEAGEPIVAQARPEAAVPTPVRGGATAYQAHRPVPASVSLEDRARERFLSAPTTITARQATVHLPARYLSEASLRGAVVEDKEGGRRVATGDAVLVVRRLTVRAASVVLVPRADGKDDVQASARGEVSFHSDQPASVIDETGLKGLFLRNDVHTPLR